jgi:hypothetical protein
VKRPRWDLLEESETKWWTQVDAAEKIRIADELRRQVASSNPGWPTDEDRREDLAHHIRLAALLRRVGRR